MTNMMIALIIVALAALGTLTFIGLEEGVLGDFASPTIAEQNTYYNAPSSYTQSDSQTAVDSGTCR